MSACVMCELMCFVNDTATTELYTYGHTLSLHVALPISDQATQPADDHPDDDGGRLRQAEQAGTDEIAPVGEQRAGQPADAAADGKDGGLVEPDVIAEHDRKSVVSGKSVSVRVDLGGRRIIKQKNKQTTTTQHLH